MVTNLSSRKPVEHLETSGDFPDTQLILRNMHGICELSDMFEKIRERRTTFMKKMKKAIASLLAVACVMMPVLQVNAGSDNQVTNRNSVETILDAYHERIANLNNGIAACSSSDDLTSGIEGIQQEIVEELQAIGYTAYSVTPESYSTVEDALDTDLQSMGLKNQYSYIVVVGDGEENGASTYSSAGSSFKYQYNNVTYTMRYLTLTSADDPAFAKATTVDLLQSASKNLITNCLNTALYAYFDAVAKPLGTIASICGLDISNFGTAGTSTLFLNTGSSWTRVYTEVWCDSQREWVIGSSVEYATCRSNMSGLYYDATSNQHENVPTNEKTEKVYSDKYYNDTWRREKAAIGYLNRIPIYDAINSVSYMYGTKIVVTHTCG